jgi:hypothetical protein
MATIETVYQVWYKRQNPTKDETSQMYHGTYKSLDEARVACYSLQEENIKIWKQHQVTEFVENVK